MKKRLPVLRYWVPRVPLVALHVIGRKRFDVAVSPTIRAMWRIGDYGI